MKTFSLSGFGMDLFRILVLLVFAYSPLALHAQLVADGQTAVLDGLGTNIADNVTIGTNGGSTRLVLTNAATVTNSGTVSIGLNAACAHNLLAVAGASTWLNSGIS